jgi:hypothetical protein
MQRLLLSAIAIAAMIVCGSRPVAAEEISITVSPNVINIASASTVVTVHTDIAFSAVVGASVYLNDVAIDWWKSDNQGNFVAKFEAEEVKGIVEPGTTAVLTLSGVTATGEEFSGTDEVQVISVKAKK